jgi:hypothetical protein
MFFSGHYKPVDMSLTSKKQIFIPRFLVLMVNWLTWAYHLSQRSEKTKIYFMFVSAYCK